MIPYLEAAVKAPASSNRSQESSRFLCILQRVKTSQWRDEIHADPGAWFENEEGDFATSNLEDKSASSSG